MNYTPTEAEEQRAIFEWSVWLSERYPELKLMFHIPNGGSRNTVEAVHLKQQGVKAGVPDIFLPVARGGYHGLFVELKRAKGGKVSESQKWWLEELKKQGYKAVVCEGSEAAIEVISEYLRSKP